MARYHAMRLLTHGTKDYSQWFPGCMNNVLDALSHNNGRSDKELTNILRSFVPEEMPESFEIVPLPKEIVSYLISLL